jgi:hypothetical protein
MVARINHIDIEGRRLHDHLPALSHVDRWAGRLLASREDLADLAAASRWETNPVRSLALAHSCYAHLPPQTPLWLGTDEFTDDDPAVITSPLSDPRHLPYLEGPPNGR